MSELKKRVSRLVSQIEAHAALPAETRQLQESDFLCQLGADARELYVEILELPDEADRNELFDDIIQGFKDAGIVLSTFKVLVEIFG